MGINSMVPVTSNVGHSTTKLMCGTIPQSFDHEELLSQAKNLNETTKTTKHKEEEDRVSIYARQSG